MVKQEKKLPWSKKDEGRTRDARRGEDDFPLQCEPIIQEATPGRITERFLWKKDPQAGTPLKLVSEKQEGVAGGKKRLGGYKNWGPLPCI